MLVAPAAAGVPAFAPSGISPFAAQKAAVEAPVTLKATYELDGKKVGREDVAGKSGQLEVTYVVRNTTAEPTVIRFKDGTGKEVVETADIVTPYVGRLAVAVPSGFRDVSADGAEVLADGSLAWSLLLFNPVGEPAQQLKWTARVRDAELPPATLQVARVTPAGAKALSSGVARAEETAAGSVKLTEGVFKIDSSVLKLRDGATTLLDGLVKLADGAGDLRAGLADKAAPGAVKLAEGMAKAEAGGAKLSTGLAELAGGADKVATGARSLSDGLGQISGGLDQLAAAGGLPAAAQGATALRVGVDKVRAGLGDPATSGTVLNGLARLGGGISQLGEAVKLGLDNPTDPANPGTKQGLQGLQKLSGAQKLALTTGIPNADPAKAVPGLKSVLGCAAPASVQLGTACALVDSLLSNPTYGYAASDGVVNLMISKIDPGKARIDAGVVALQDGVTKLTGGANQIAAGVQSGDPAKPGLAEGLDALVAGLTKAVGGVTALSGGAQKATAGSVALADGSSKLAAGAGKASTGSGDLHDGLGRLLTGSQSLASGLGDAAEGSGKLEDGIVKVRDGVEAVRDGATELSGRGTSALGGSVNAAAHVNNQRLAMLKAVAARGEESADQAAFDVVLASAETDSGMNPALLGAGAVLALLALGGTGLVLARRRGAQA